MIKGAIFDLDGTILDSMNAWDNVGEDILLRYGIVPDEPLENQIQGLSFKKTAEFLIENFGVPLSAYELIAEVNNMVGDKYRYQIPLKEGIREFLEELKTRGIPMCVATVTSYDLAREALLRLGVLSYFQFIITCHEVGCGKESPVIYNRAAEILKHHNDEVAVFEDSLYCAYTARDVGFYVVGIYDDSSADDDDEMRAVCHEFLQSWYETPRFLLEEKNS